MQTTFQFNTPFGHTAYSQTVTVEKLDRAEEARIIEAARAGNQAARAALAEICRGRAWKRALRLAEFYQSILRVYLDPQDIAQEAAVRVLLRMDKALAAPNPIGYLFQAIEGAMLTFCRESQSVVRVPNTAQSRGCRLVEVVSLDAVLPGTDVTLLDLVVQEG